VLFGETSGMLLPHENDIKQMMLKRENQVLTNAARGLFERLENSPSRFRVKRIEFSHHIRFSFFAFEG
jgi:hypothetical protein